MFEDSEFQGDVGGFLDCGWSSNFVAPDPVAPASHAEGSPVDNAKTSMLMLMLMWTYSTSTRS